MELTPGFTVSKWNGTKRTRPVRRAVTVHCTESGSARSTVEYFKRMTGRYGGYHSIGDGKGIYHLARADEYRMYHAGVKASSHPFKVPGANDTIGISGGYWKNNPSRPEQSWFHMPFFGKLAIFNSLGQIVLDHEEHLGFKIPRVYRGDIGEGQKYADARRANLIDGFWGHTDISPHTRSDPGWTYKEWDIFFEVLAGLETPKPAVEVPRVEVPEISPVEAEFQAAIDAGITNGSNPEEPATRREAAVMAYRASQKGK